MILEVAVSIEYIVKISYYSIELIYLIIQWMFNLKMKMWFLRSDTLNRAQMKQT